jgi:hypothetical protein
LKIIITKKELKRVLGNDIDVRIKKIIKQISRLEDPLMVFQINII